MGISITDRYNATFNLSIRIVEAASMENAIKKASFHVIGDATRSFKRAGSPMAESGLFLFCKQHLEKYTGSEQGEGYIVTLDKPKLGRTLEIRKERILPNQCSINRLHSCYVLYDTDGHEVYAMYDVVGIDEALLEAKRLINEGIIELEGKITCRFEYRFAKGTSNAVFKIGKTNRKTSGRLGRYLLFGIQSIL